ncbi:MAG: SpvB/TcaC N-terminal domain-containing protein [Polyangiaceae bacterium]
MDEKKDSPKPATTPHPTSSSEDKRSTPRDALSGERSPAQRSFQVAAAPSMELPKGGGAIRGIGETFNVNAATGTGSFGVPLPLSPSPRGPTPELALSYDSGSGNSVFGLGWSVSVPAITRKTDKKVPEYLDSEDSDLFLLSGAEDLVPTLDAGGARVTSSSTVGTVTTRVDAYRPRVEGLFSIIERVTVTDTGPTPSRNVYWRACTRDNVKSTFGQSAAARVADPASPTRVYSWLLERTEDDRGNVVLYVYKQENADNQPVGKPSEVHHKDGLAPITANRYLKRVLYGNTTMSDTTGASAKFELVFDFGEHTANTPAETTTWGCRQDIYSSFRPGFELRTYRVCRRVLMFHRFASLSPNPYLVRSLDLTYDENRRVSKLTRVDVVGYEHNGTTYVTKSLPGVSFAYTPDTLSRSIKDLTTDDLGTDYPQSLIGSKAEWVDLDQEGLPGLLIDHGGAHRYKRNVGGKLQGGATLETVPTLLMDAAERPVQLMDVAGAGTLSMVLQSGNASGFSERTSTGWGAFTPFKSFPAVDLHHPNLRFLDLNGDGFEDILVLRGDHLVWYPSLGKEGYGPGRRVPIDTDLERGPCVLFAEPTALVAVADMNGDGLADIVRVTHSGVVYWPNVGHGRFGAAVRMNTAPWLAAYPLLFDARRVRLVDLDGTGCADLCFFHEDGTFVVYRNESGNGFDAGEAFPLPPEAHATGQFVDFYGAGTSAYVYSLRSHPAFLAKVWDPLGHAKPHLLKEVDNHMGKTVRLAYAPSTKFYVEDRKAGRPWVTKLPFPVHVVERVETYDAVRRARLVSTYAYHHGHYDTVEREFRGFGRVDQTDTESFGKDHGQGLFPSYPVTNNEIPQDPVVTKTWFRTGAWTDRAAQEAQYLSEYWSGDPLVTTHLAAGTDSDFTPRERREAHRALRGTVMRTEVYELDGTTQAAIPHVVTESIYAVRKLQSPQNALGADRPQLPGVFHVVDLETRSLTYERNASDPRVAQTFALEVDAYGVTVRAAALAHPRRGTGRPAEQKTVHCTVTIQTVAHLPGTFDSGRRIAIPLEAKVYDLRDMRVLFDALPSEGDFVDMGEVAAAFGSASEIPYEEEHAGPADTRRLIQHEIAQYYDSATLTPLAVGTADVKALLYKSYLLDITPGLLTSVYSAKASGPELTALLTEGAYTTPSGQTGHWIPSGHAVFDATKFFLPTSLVDPFGATTTIAYDADKMFAISVTDALSNVVAATHDYRVLAPKEITDPNGNRKQAGFDALGMLKAIAIMGKTGGTDGDSLADPTVEYTYDLTRWDTAQKPNWTKVRAREKHGAANPRWQESKVYTDGGGGVAMTKVEAEPATPGGPARYVGSGRTVLNNKGNPVKQYEPYFSSTQEYEDEDSIVATGVTSVVTYDALGRVERTDLPNGTYSRVERTPWLETSYDPNDTVTESGNAWRAARQPTATPTPSAEEQRARALTELHAATPTKTHVDTLGRAFLVVAHNKVGAADEFVETRTKLDIESQVLAVTDAQNRVCQTNVFSMAGKLLKETNLDLGSRWHFHDAAGALIRRWDDRTQTFRVAFDALRRATELFLKVGAGAETLLQKTVYGDDAGLTAPETNNLRGQAIRVFDGAGRVKSENYDFKGNRLSSERRLAVAYTTTPSWSPLSGLTSVSAIDTAAASLLETETFSESRTFDALGRVVSATSPDGSIFLPTYNEANLLEKVDVRVRGSATATPFVADVDYDAKGRRTEITYATGNFKTTYEYDPLTFRLTRVLTTRTTPSETLQDLKYTFDPVGNIVESTDGAQQSLLFTNGFATVPNRYEYDALYRLKRGEGREHKSVGDVQVDENDQAIFNLPHPNDPQAIRSYFETYVYDKVGNILEMFHSAGGGVNTWTRTYNYGAGTPTNRLVSHNVPGGTATFGYDAHGSITSMPHLSTVTTTPFDQMKSADKGGGGIVYFTYAADGKRVRKVWEKTASLKDERIYLGSYEIFRQKTSGVTQLERQTLHVMDGVKRLAMVETKTINGGAAVTPLVDRMRYQLGNHLESAILEVDETGLIISYEEYSPYGTSSYRSARSGVDVSARRYRYVGLERDDETGFYSMGARYYCPWLGRWTTADPIGIAAGLNVFAYCRGSPVTMSDPGGLAATKALPPETEPVLTRAPEGSGSVEGSEAAQSSAAVASGVYHLGDDGGYQHVDTSSGEYDPGPVIGSDAAGNYIRQSDIDYQREHPVDPDMQSTGAGGDKSGYFNSPDKQLYQETHSGQDPWTELGKALLFGALAYLSIKVKAIGIALSLLELAQAGGDNDPHLVLGVMGFLGARLGEPEGVLYEGKYKDPWTTINPEEFAPGVIPQAPQQCAAACGEMLSGGEIAMGDLSAVFPNGATGKQLAAKMNQLAGKEKFRFGVIKDATEQEVLQFADDGPFIAGMDANGSGHAVVVEGVSENGNLIIADPIGARRYEMTVLEFRKWWTGQGVWKK